MQLSYINKIGLLLAIASSFQFASADNTYLEVWEGEECVELITGADSVPIGEVCTEVDVDNVVVTFNMSAPEVIEADCCIKETHICNMPPMIADIEGEDGCLKTKVVSFDIMEVFGFMCSEQCDMFQFNGHATILCDQPLKGDPTPEGGDPLPGDVGQGNYGDQEWCYGAMYDVGLICGPDPDACTNEPCGFTCEAPAPVCGSRGGAGGPIECFCSETASGDDFCWQDIGCFVPIFYLTTTTGVYCQSDDVCKAGTRCVPSTCCDGSVCLPECIPTFGDKELDDFAEKYGIPPEELEKAMKCDTDPTCTMPSGKGDKFEYP